MLVINEHLHRYYVVAEKNMAETGQFVTLSFSNRSADIRFCMSIKQAKQIQEALKEALDDE